MKISKETVEYLGKLSRIELSQDEKDLLSKQLEDILNYFESLNKLNTKDTSPTCHVVALKNVFRKDVCKESLPSDKVLKNAPAKDESYFKVPKIV